MTGVLVAAGILILAVAVLIDLVCLKAAKQADERDDSYRLILEDTRIADLEELWRR